MGNGAHRMKLVQDENGWETHIMDGTLLMVEDKDGNEQEALVQNIEGRVVTFVCQDITAKSIDTLTVVRGNEALNQIKTNMRFAKKKKP